MSTFLLWRRKEEKTLLLGARRGRAWGFAALSCGARSLARGAERLLRAARRLRRGQRGRKA